MRKRVTVLGSTGSIGKQSLDVVRTHPDLFEVYAICGGNNAALLAQQAAVFRPKRLGSLAPLDTASFPYDVKTTVGAAAAEEIASDGAADIIVNGISGISALRPLLASLHAGKTVALANKESIVCGKRLVDQALKAFGGRILPVDSEQSAIFQCLCGGKSREVSRLILTASGGPFWQQSFDELGGISVTEALHHPTWNMGRKITIDSATLFNKGLEIIEAAYLFDIPGDRIDVLIHPQSIVHSMVEYCDGTVLANLSCPDMRLPIQYALTWPDRQIGSCKRLSLAEAGALAFYPAQPERYPALRLAYEALRQGGTMPTVYNGANEAAVAHYLAGDIRFTDIYAAVEAAMQQHKAVPVDSLETVFAADQAARAAAEDLLLRRRNNG